jgi:hypothetical protein
MDDPVSYHKGLYKQKEEKRSRSTLGSARLGRCKKNVPDSMDSRIELAAESDHESLIIALASLDN